MLKRRGVLAGAAGWTIVGGFVPSGPILAFPIVVVLLNSGAGLPQVVSDAGGNAEIAVAGDWRDRFGTMSAASIASLSK